MSRWIGLVVDPTAGGSTYETLEGTSGLAIPVPTLFIPASTAQMEPGVNPLERKDEVRGRRAEAAPISFASDPTATFTSRGYPEVVRRILRSALGGSITSTGTAPAAITSSLGTLQEGNLPALIVWLLREGQLDRLTGAVVADFEMDFPVEGESTIQATLEGLFHDAQASASPKDPNAKPAVAYPTPEYKPHQYTYLLRDAVAFKGPSAGTEIPDLAGFKLSFNNGMIKDFRSRYRPNHNIQKQEIESVIRKLWLPAKHKIGAQTVTGTVTLSDVDPNSEAVRLMTAAEKLVFEVFAGPLATTPPSTEALKLTLYKQVYTGGGADPLVREGDQTSAYTFTAYIDETTNKDVEASFVGKEALT
jgi:hypothetical protein